MFSRDWFVGENRRSLGFARDDKGESGGFPLRLLLIENTKSPFDFAQGRSLASLQ